MSKSIYTSLAPNLQSDDVWLSLGLILQPWRWISGQSAARLAANIGQMHGASYARAFATGRGALDAILESADIGRGDDVLLQAYTCVAVPEPVLWRGARPVYVDIDPQTLNMSAEDLKKKITPRAKAIIIQHTFGNPADLRALLAVAREHRLYVIEDCAHSLGALYQNVRVGSMGDAAFFSFGRDKVISSVFGGVAITRNPKTGKKLASLSRPKPGAIWVLRQLLYAPLMSIARATQGILFGKLLLRLFLNLRVIAKPVENVEWSGGRPDFTCRSMPEALAVLALHQLSKLDSYNAHRKKIAGIYRATIKPDRAGAQNVGEQSEPVWLRYALFSPDASDLLASARRVGLYLGDWYREAIAPKQVDFRSVGYDPATCPSAETASRQSLNLPTSIGIAESDAGRIAKFINSYVN